MPADEAAASGRGAAGEAEAEPAMPYEHQHAPPGEQPLPPEDEEFYETGEGHLLPAMQHWRWEGGRRWQHLPSWCATQTACGAAAGRVNRSAKAKQSTNPLSPTSPSAEEFQNMQDAWRR